MSNPKPLPPVSVGALNITEALKTCPGAVPLGLDPATRTVVALLPDGQAVDVTAQIAGLLARVDELDTRLDAGLCWERTPDGDLIPRILPEPDGPEEG